MADFKALGEKLNGFSFPRSAELPDLDFYMDQVVSLMEKKLYILSDNEDVKFITPSMINNYVKLGLIPPPKKKRYTKEHLCYLFIICTLKSVIPIPAVTRIIKAETEKRSIFELYDIFCEAYENMLAQANSAAKEIVSEADFEEATAKLALFMSINAAATQLVATNALAHLPEYETLPEKPEKKDKEKKDKQAKK